MSDDINHEIISEEELTELQQEQYLKDVEVLLLSPEFVRLIVRWVHSSRAEHGGPVASNRIETFNYNLGYAQLMDEFMEGLGVLHPQAFMEITQGVLEYGRRRRNAGDTGDGSDTGYDFDRDDD